MAVRKAVEHGTYEKRGWSKAGGEPQLVAFRYVPTRQRLRLRRDGNDWTLDWGGKRNALPDWARLETKDGESWVVVRPRAGTVTYPRLLTRGLRGSDMTAALWNAQQQAVTVAASPECAEEKPRAAAVAQIIAALREAIRTTADGDKVINSMNTLSRRYLRRLSFGTPEAPITASDGQGRRITLDRAAAAKRLARFWLDLLPFRSARNIDNSECVRFAEEFIDAVRSGSLYAQLASELPGLGSVGWSDVQGISQLYAAAYEKVMEARYGRLCARCAPGLGGLGPKGRNHYAEPMPWEPGWGCKSGPRCTRELGGVREVAKDEARSILRRAATVLGMPANKARSMFDFERLRWERSTGKRSAPRRGGRGR